MTGAEALRLSAEVLAAIVRDDYSRSRSLVELAEWLPVDATDEQLEALGALERFGVEYLASRIDEPLPEIVEVDPPEQIESIRQDGSP